MNLTGYQIQSCLSKFLTESVREFPHSLLFSSHYVNKNCHKSDPEDKCIDSATPLTNIKQIMTGQLGTALVISKLNQAPTVRTWDFSTSTTPPVPQAATPTTSSPQVTQQFGIGTMETKKPHQISLILLIIEQIQANS